jgi:hypothetical protein
MTTDAQELLSIHPLTPKFLARSKEIVCKHQRSVFNFTLRVKFYPSAEAGIQG